MHKVKGGSPNEFHFEEVNGVMVLQPGLRETQHRVLPGIEQVRAQLAELDAKSEQIANAEAEIEAKVQAAKDGLEEEQQKLRDERKLFEAQVAEFNRQKKAGGK